MAVSRSAQRAMVLPLSVDSDLGSGQMALPQTPHLHFYIYHHKCAVRRYLPADRAESNPNRVLFSNVDVLTFSSKVTESRFSAKQSFDAPGVGTSRSATRIFDMQLIANCGIVTTRVNWNSDGQWAHDRRLPHGANIHLHSHI